MNWSLHQRLCGILGHKGEWGAQVEFDEHDFISGRRTTGKRFSDAWRVCERCGKVEVRNTSARRTRPI